MLCLPTPSCRAGLSVLTADADGFDHSIVIEVDEPHSLDSACPAGVSPCLADGALRVTLDGEEALLAPGTVFLGQDVQVSAVNLPGQCRSFGFEKVRSSVGGVAIHWLSLLLWLLVVVWRLLGERSLRSLYHYLHGSVEFQYSSAVTGDVCQ